MTNLEPVLDLPLLRKAVEWVEVEALKPEQEREWDQWYYRLPAEVRSQLFGTDCNSAYCVAGYICHLAGYEWMDNSWGTLSNGVDAHETAATLLGITDNTAVRLFREGNTAADIRWIAESIAEKAGEKL